MAARTTPAALWKSSLAAFAVACLLLSAPQARAVDEPTLEQIDAASTRISTSSAFGVGTGTSSSTRPASGPRFRTARIVSTAAR